MLIKIIHNYVETEFAIDFSPEQFVFIKKDSKGLELIGESSKEYILSWDVLQLRYKQGQAFTCNLQGK